MKKHLCFLLILCAPLSAESAGEKAVMEFYAGFSMAVEMKFADAMVSHRTADYRGFDEFGRVRTSAADFDRFRRIFGESVSVHCRNKLVGVSGSGESLVCRVEQLWDYSKKVASDFPKLRVTHEKWILEDTWLQRSGEWKLSRSVVKSRTLPRW